MNCRDQFIVWYEGNFKYSYLYEAMAKTVEDSPYHREANTGVHTDMVVAEYMRLSPEEWSVHDLLGAIACAYHDVGKPSAEETITRADGTTYRRYAGHEKISARLFMDTFELQGIPQTFNLNWATNYYAISWMIEYHVPWSLGNDKLRNVKATVNALKLEDAFIRVLLADQNGRDSDPERADKRQISEWVDKFNDLDPAPFGMDDTKPTMYFMLGPSGSGKTTWLKNACDLRFSLDDLKLEMYDPNDYDKSWNMANEDKTFNQQVQKRYVAMLKELENQPGKVIAVDTAFGSKKKRNFYLSEARRRKFNLVCVLFLTPLQTILDRQDTRTDKTVPRQAVINQYMSVQLPSFGEFDNVFVVWGT